MTLEYWFCWPGIYQEKQRAILDVFEKEMNDQIKINDLSIASNIRDKLLTAVAAGEAPDNAACFGDLVSLAAKGAFIPVDEYVKASSIMKLDALYQPRVQATIWRNTQYGFPYNCSAELILWNSDILTEVGSDPTKQIETWAEMTEISKKIVMEDDSGMLTRAAYTNFVAPRHRAVWFWINDGDAYDATNDKITIDQPANLEGLQTVINYAWDVYGDIARADEFVAGAGSEAESPFCVGEMAATIDGDWGPSTYNTWCPGIKMWPQLFPKAANGTAPVAMGAGDFIGILRGAAAPRSGLSVCRMDGDEGQQDVDRSGRRHQLRGGRRRHRARRLARDLRRERRRVVEVVGRSGRVSTKAVENFPAYGFMNDELMRVFDLAFHKQMTAEEALAEAQKNVEAEMDKYTIS